MMDDGGEANAPLQEGEILGGMDREGVRRAVHRLDTLPIDQFPLFMQTLSGDGDTGENVPLEALQALLYEGTPEEQARNFKTQGNECYVLGKPGPLQDAVRFYTRGLDTGCQDPELVATLYLNRSAACLALGRAEDAFRDAQRALSHLAPAEEAEAGQEGAQGGGGCAETEVKQPVASDPPSPSLPLSVPQSPPATSPQGPTLRKKALHRIIKTALLLGRAEEARAALTALEGLSTEAIDQETMERLERLEERRARERAAAVQEEQRLQSVRRLVAGRGLTVVAGAERQLLEHFGPEMLKDGYQLPTVQALSSTRKRRDRSPTQQGLAWPVLLLYPEEAQSDWLEAVDEESCLQDILETVLVPRPPWDSQHNYSPSTVHVYWHEAHPEGRREEDRLVQLRPHVQLNQLIGTLIKTIDRGILSFLICPAHASARLLARYHRQCRWGED